MSAPLMMRGPIERQSRFGWVGVASTDSAAAFMEIPPGALATTAAWMGIIFTPPVGLAVRAWTSSIEALVTRIARIISRTVMAAAWTNVQ